MKNVSYISHGKGRLTVNMQAAWLVNIIVTHTLNNTADIHLHLFI